MSLDASDVTSRVTYLIVGAGPAGLQLGYFMDRARLDYHILERADGPGDFFRTFPRHRTLISVNKTVTGTDDPEKKLRWDWNSLLDDGPRFTAFSERYFPSADTMLHYLSNFAARHKLRISYETEVLRITRPDGFVVETTRGVWSADRVIIATGVATDNIPAIPGIEHAESYREVSTNPSDFRGQRVLIIGKGNSALETANNLIETTAALHLVSPTPVRMAWRTHFVGDVRAVNSSVLDTYGLKSENTILNAEVKEVRRTDHALAVKLRYTRAQGQDVELFVDRVLRCTGFRCDANIFDGCMPKLVLDGRFPALTTSWESVNVPDLFFAGSLMQSRDYHRTFSAFIHGFRYNIQTMVQLLQERYHGVPRPWRSVSLKSEDLVRALLTRANGASSLFQQPAFLADVLRFAEDHARHYESLPADLARDELAAEHVGTALLLTLEYGVLGNRDPFDVERFPDDGERTHLLHPVVRTVHDGRIIAEHHVAEDLENDWSAARHVDPLRRFLERELTRLR
jgi:thioredoxin reductase